MTRHTFWVILGIYSAVIGTVSVLHRLGVV